jgi:hypothetical protein
MKKWTEGNKSASKIKIKAIKENYVYIGKEIKRVKE